MPTYEYICKACLHEWEEEQKITDDPIEQCPACYENEAKRQISCKGFVLNGTCWAKDLYA